MLSMLGIDALAGVLSAIALAIGGVVVAYWRGRSRGATDTKNDAMRDDYENAQDIRRRVATDRAQRMRELDGVGFRDD